MKFLKSPALALATVFALAAVFSASNSVAADEHSSQCLLEVEDLRNDSIELHIRELLATGIISKHIQEAQNGKKGSLEIAEFIVRETFSGDAKESYLMMLLPQYLQNGDESSLDKAEALLEELSGDNKEMMVMALMGQYLQNGEDSSLVKAAGLVKELSGDNKEMMVMALMAQYLQNGDESSLDKAEALLEELSDDNKEMMLMAIQGMR